MVALGFLAGRRGWVGSQSGRDLSNLVFLLLGPALMFRSMAAVHPEQLDLRPVAAYFAAASVLFAGTFVLRGFSRRSALLAMANTYSNAVMIGIPLIGLAYGASGMVTLLTLVSLHSLVLLTAATVAMELAVAREAAQAGQGAGRHVATTLVRAVRNAVVHPVPIPIILGLLYGQTGWAIPPIVDKPLQLLGQAFGPLALIMVGITLAHTRIGDQLRGALALTGVKNLLHPLLVALIGLLLGVDSLPLQVMVIASSLPIGANVFLLAQRYQVAQPLATAAVAVSTALGLLTVSLVLVLARLL